MKKRTIFYLLIFTISLSEFAYSHRETLLDFYRSMTSASSTLIERGKNKEFYAPWKAIDGDLKTSWVEGAKGEGVGQYINMRIGNIDRKLVAVDILPGVAANKRLFAVNNRPKDIRLVLYWDKFIDYNNTEYIEITHYDYRLKDKREFQRIELTNIDEVFKKYRENVKLRIIIKSVYKGRKYNDTAISEIKLLDASGRDLIKNARNMAIKIEKRTKNHVNPK